MQDRLDWLSRGWKEARPHMDISPWMVWGRTTRIHEIFLSVVGRSLGRHKLNFKEFQTLGALTLSGPPYQLKPSAIARWNLLTSGGITNLLTRMEKEGLISRAPDPDDGRGVLVQITERGRELFDRAVEEENKIEHELLHVLSPAERETLSGLLRKLLGSIDHDDFGNSEFDGAAPR